MLHRQCSTVLRRSATLPFRHYKVGIVENRSFRGSQIQVRYYCKIEESDDEKRIPPPPHLENDVKNPLEWTYPIIVGAIGGLITAGFYFFFQKKETIEKPATTSSKNSNDGEEDGDSEFTYDGKDMESTDGVPPVSPLHVIDSFPYLPEDTRELESTFRYAGTFCIALGPRDFNNYHLIHDYLSDNRHAVVFSVHPRSYSSSILQEPRGGSRKGKGQIRELLKKCLSGTVDFGLVPMIEQVGGDVFEQLSQLIQLRGPSSDQFIWIDHFDVIMDYIDNLEDAEQKKQEEADLRCLLSWLVDMSLHREWSQVLIQSNDPELLSRLEPYLPHLRATPAIRKISLGERSEEDIEQRLNQLLVINEICLTPEDIAYVLKHLGGAVTVLENVVKLLLAGNSLQDIVESQIRPLVIGLEQLLVKAPYRVALWELMEKLVANYDKTGNIYVSHRVVTYSPSAKERFAEMWQDVEDYFYYFENPTLEMLRQAREKNSQAFPSACIAASSTRAMTAMSLLVHDPDIKRVMWNEKKKTKADEGVVFFESSVQ